MKSSYRNVRTAQAMQEQAEGLAATQAEPGKYILCGKLRIDRDGIVGYLKSPLIVQRESFFDHCTHGQDFGTVENLREVFREFLPKWIKAYNRKK